MLYLKIRNGKVESFGDIETMKKITGSTEPDKVVDESEWRAANGSAQVVNGEIVLGMDADSKFELLRLERDNRLGATDYLLMPDYPITMERKAQVEAYRQALRDLPAQNGAPWDGGGSQTPWPTL